ncbi:MAG: hypothetical protein ABEK59_07050 [Halobacteria archaeon]
MILPLPSEIVLAAPLRLGLPGWLHFTVIVLVSGLGKTAGSLLALMLGLKPRGLGSTYIQRNYPDSVLAGMMDGMEATNREVIEKYGYLGLVTGLSVPFVPDTLSIYAFALLESDYAKFGMAVFVGSVNRLLIAGGIIAGLT